jgi:hypothetical protein
MMIAAALVKPAITGCERKLTTIPSRSSPRPSWTIPTSSASAIASAT